MTLVEVARAVGCSLKTASRVHVGPRFVRRQSRPGIQGSAGRPSKIVNRSQVAMAMAKTVRPIPSELVRSITWDQGREMAHHARFLVATGVAGRSVFRGSEGPAGRT